MVELVYLLSKQRIKTEFVYQGVIMDKQKILIVDDEEVNRAILEIMFQTEFEVIQASNGEEAIKQIEENPDIVLILLDIVMPVMDGFGVLEYMQSKELLEVKPVILITGETIRDSGLVAPACVQNYGGFCRAQGKKYY